MGPWACVMPPPCPPRLRLRLRALGMATFLQPRRSARLLARRKAGRKQRKGRERGTWPTRRAGCVVAPKGGGATPFAVGSNARNGQGRRQEEEEAHAPSTLPLCGVLAPLQGSKKQTRRVAWHILPLASCVGVGHPLTPLLLPPIHSTQEAPKERPKKASCLAPEGETQEDEDEDEAAAVAAAAMR